MHDDHGGDALHSLSLGDVSRENRRRYPLQTAVVCGETRLTYPELDQRVTALAAALEAEGVEAGDRVLWLGQNCHRVLELTLALSKLGAVVCPVNWRQSEGELVFVVNDAAPRVVIAQRGEVAAASEGARDASGYSGPWWWAGTDDNGGSDEYEAHVAQHLARGATDDERTVVGSAPVLMIYSAAFSGHPNGTLLTTQSLMMESMVTALMERLDASHVYLNSGPLFHIGVWRYTLATYLLGGTNVFIRRVDAEEICRLIEAERCTGAYLVGLTQEQIVECNAEGRYDLSCLRSPPGPPGWDVMVTVETTPWTQYPQRYGQTEAGGVVAFGGIGPPPLGGSGRANPFAQLRIVDDDGVEVPDGGVGEIVVRGPMVMQGYHNRPEINAGMYATGWRRTNDLGRREPDGSITFIAPKGRLLKSGRENIYPAEVENALRAHPEVADCAVIGVPDDVWIQSVKAIVVAADGCSPDPAVLIEHTKRVIARYKAPKSIEFVASLPRTGPTVDYDALDAQFGGGGYPGGSTRT